MMIIAYVILGYIEEVNPSKFSTQVDDPLTAAIAKVQFIHIRTDENMNCKYVNKHIFLKLEINTVLDKHL
jgi:hypothetical protein